MSFTSFTIIVKTWGAVASPKGREENWNTCDLCGVRPWRVLSFQTIQFQIA